MLLFEATQKHRKMFSCIDDFIFFHPKFQWKFLKSILIYFFTCYTMGWNNNKKIPLLSNLEISDQNVWNALRPSSFGVAFFYIRQQDSIQNELFTSEKSYTI